MLLFAKGLHFLITVGFMNKFFQLSKNLDFARKNKPTSHFESNVFLYQNVFGIKYFPAKTFESFTFHNQNIFLESKVFFRIKMLISNQKCFFESKVFISNPFFRIKSVFESKSVKLIFTQIPLSTAHGKIRLKYFRFLYFCPFRYIFNNLI